MTTRENLLRGETLAAANVASPEQRTRTQAAGAGIHPEGACDR